jgi:hypothetical protein
MTIKREKIRPLSDKLEATIADALRSADVVKPAVASAMAKASSMQAGASLFAAVEPADEPVVLTDLLDGLVGAIDRHL